MSEPLPYATPQPSQNRPIVIASIIGVLSLGLIVLAGCFLIGVGAAHSVANNPVVLSPFSSQQAITAVTNWSPGKYLYVAVLYACAGGCLVGALILMIVAVKRLLSLA